MLKNIINYILNNLSKKSNNFKLHKFEQNNFRILIIATFLFFEQLTYAFFVRKSGTLLQQIHYFTAIIMIFYIFLSFKYRKQLPAKVTLFHQIYEGSIGFCGLMVAIIRIIYVQHEIFRLPTIFIAVLFGVAVFFYYNYIQSFIVYLLTALIIVFIVPKYQPDILTNSYIADTLSNTMIAWIASMINFQRFYKVYNNNLIIQKKNNILKEKTAKIKKINRKLKKLSIKDGLTDIYNRRKLDTELKKVINKAQRYNEVFSVILLDLDEFKDINDNFGHDRGDQILIEISSLLKESIRRVDIVGRWGGEEFLIICPGTNREEAYNLAERLRNKIMECSFSDNIKITSSFGIASYTIGDKIENIIKRADKKLYKAKERGRNKVIK